MSAGAASRLTEAVLVRCAALESEGHAITRDSLGGFSCRCGFHSGFGGEAVTHMLQAPK